MLLLYTITIILVSITIPLLVVNIYIQTKYIKQQRHHKRFKTFKNPHTKKEVNKK